MKKNLGKIDRALRIILGIAIIVFGVLNTNWFGAVGLIPIITAMIGWCPLYSPFKINTCSKDKCEV